MFYMPDTSSTHEGCKHEETYLLFLRSKPFLKMGEDKAVSLTDLTGPKSVPSSVVPLSIKGKSTLSVTQAKNLIHL